MSPTIEGVLDAKGLKVALVVSRFNDFITTALLRGAEDFLERHGCPAKNRTVVMVPGSWEIPQAAKRLAQSKDYDAVVALGALVRGETPHFELLAAEVAKGLAQIGMETGIPVIFGVLTTDTVEQAIDRAGAKAGNKGWDAALSAVEMVNLYRRMA
jgi:6,7-dimethyl-8-ribityllumazine synthase